mgnify:CR=1 FL=1
MPKVTDITKNQPHLRLVLSDGVHVFPVAWLKDWIAGVPCAPPSDEMIKALIRDFLIAEGVF